MIPPSGHEPLLTSLSPSTAVASPLEGLKIVTRETFPAGTTETTTFVASDRVRVESRRPSHESVHISRCDLNRTFVLNPADRTCQSGPLETRFTRIERFVFSLRRAASEPKEDPELVIETTTVDTGERKIAFGYAARRVVSTRREISGGQVSSTRETVTDGWYIDLETRPACARQETGRAVLIGVVSPAGTRPRVPRVPRLTFKDIGDREEGFALETTTTWRASGEEASAPLPVVIHSEVTYLSRERFEASLFDVPEGYRSTDRLFDAVAARWGRTAQIIRSVVASWFGRAR